MSNEFINLGSATSSRDDFSLRYISISKYEGDWNSSMFCAVRVSSI